MEKLHISASPHIRQRCTVTSLLFHVIAALLPTVSAGCLVYGTSGVMVLCSTVCAAVAADLLCSLAVHQPKAALNGSSVITGLLLGLSLPADIPIWHAALGSVIAIVLVKQLFGGIGKNFANPAMTAKIVLMVLYASEMKIWHMTAAQTAAEKWTSSGAVIRMLLEQNNGMIGESCGIAIILGGLYLVIKKIISPVTPLSYFISYAVLNLVFRMDVPAELTSGSLLLGCFFLSADYTTTPLTVPGKCLFGIGCGCLTFLIRYLGGFGDSVALAVVIMNLFTPLLDSLTRTKPFGTILKLPSEPAESKS
ncbi:MAG: RnfABCDGE type electron transport complex subunit D [Oscillospiraceae bacterium]|nr:RnfABCDGE type electron transport complex subunit D [Oscillospiraceae bacterium]